LGVWKKYIYKVEAFCSQFLGKGPVTIIIKNGQKVKYFLTSDLTGILLLKE
jgi:hypothetical protein